MRLGLNWYSLLSLLLVIFVLFATFSCRYRTPNRNLWNIFFTVFILFTHHTSWIFNRRLFFSPPPNTKRVLLLCLIQLPTHMPASSFFLLSALLLLIPVINLFFPTWVLTDRFYISSFRFLTRMTLCPVKASHVNEIVTFCISNWMSLNNWQLLLTLPSSQSCSLSIMLTITLSFG